MVSGKRFRIMVRYRLWAEFYLHTHATYPTRKSAEARLAELKKRHGDAKFEWKIEEVEQ